MIRVCALLVAALTLVLQSTDRDVGFIVDVRGRWDLMLADGSIRDAKPSQIVRSGDMIRKLDLDPSAFVIVAMFASGQNKAFTTTTTLESEPATSTLSRILHLIQQRFDQGFVTASVRGGLQFEDAIVPAREDSTDVSPVFAGTAAVSYQVDAYRIRAGRPSSTPAARGRVRAGAAPVTLPRLAPGAYELIISGSGAGAAGSAWIFVAPPDRYQDAARTFADLRRIDANADANMRAAARLLARGYMTVLDDETPR